jgi:hypothetical protein
LSDNFSVFIYLIQNLLNKIGTYYKLVLNLSSWNNRKPFRKLRLINIIIRLMKILLFIGLPLKLSKISSVTDHSNAFTLDFLIIQNVVDGFDVKWHIYDFWDKQNWKITTNDWMLLNLMTKLSQVINVDKVKRSLL